MKKKKIGIEVTENNIKSLRLVNEQCKCFVQCPNCPKLVPCNFEKNWRCGNFQSHLKSHKSVESSVEEIYEVNENNKLEKVRHTNMNIIRVSNELHLKTV